MEGAVFLATCGGTDPSTAKGVLRCAQCSGRTGKQCRLFVELILEIIRDALPEINVVGRSTDQDSDQDTDQDNTPINRPLSALGNDTLSAAELMKRLHLSYRLTFRKNYLHPALKQGLIEGTLPDQPNSKNQKAAI
jgi:putative transcriptional regulator